MSRHWTRIVLLALLLLNQGAQAVAPEVDNEEMEARRRANGLNPNMYNLDVLMKENQIYMEFINVAISNMISPKSENQKSPSELKESELSSEENSKNIDSSYYYDFLKANQKDLEGSIYYFKGEYSTAYRPLRESQGKLKEMYESVLERHNEFSRVLIFYASNHVLRTKDRFAKHLIKKAYKELKIAEDFYTLGFNAQPNLFRNKLSLYRDGIQASRRARRFALLALIEFKTPNDEKANYRKQKMNAYRDAEYDGTSNNYEYLKRTLRNFIENKWLDSKISASVPFERPETATGFTYNPGNDTPPLDLMEILDDCYGIITYNRISVLEETNLFIKRENTPKIEGAAASSGTNPNPSGTNPGTNNTSSPEPAKATPN
ncbi:MAG: hypothetical protein H7A24_17715 [Leptospiraceae bacterium]|nr:hypothetical protein [Leptospiraceae bacterium]MCP5513732.1 hypothetical protein [Leptospiraceae bacterium]